LLFLSFFRFDFNLWAIHCAPFFFFFLSFLFFDVVHERHPGHPDRPLVEEDLLFFFLFCSSFFFLKRTCGFRSLSEENVFSFFMVLFSLSFLKEFPSCPFFLARVEKPGSLFFFFSIFFPLKNSERAGLFFSAHR